ncbi:MAG: hypothetical protein HYV33_06130 [Candidatus Kerfeldbacteria bacterium]|nr:hypothetical protein [Candidatus Kerfeldbacteria bacterium]
MKAVWLGLTIVTVLLFLPHHWSAELSDPDAFYHMKMAQLLTTQGVIQQFPWLPYTTLNQHFTDQHLLFHVLMMPFVTWGDPFVGIKLFTITLATVFIIVFATTLRAVGLRWWLPVTLALLVTVPFTFRLNLVKATPLALILLCLAWLGIVKKRWWWVSAITVVYVWSYGGFAMLYLVLGCWLVSQWLTQPWRSWASTLWPMLAVGTGTVLGLIVNPYFPNNILFYWDQLVQIGIINYRDSISVGAEWYTYNIAELLLGSVVLFSAAIVSLTLLIIQRRRWAQLDWFAVFLALLGIALTIKSRRYVEYFGPYLAIAVAIWLRHQVVTWAGVVQLMVRQWKIASLAVAVLAVVIFTTLPVVLADVERNISDVRGGISVTKFKHSSQWLQTHAPPGSVVLHSDWDDFPSLFYYNSQAVYMAGLDPTFMYRFNPTLYQLWVDLTTGDYHGDVSAALTTLAVDYVLIEHDHVAMERLIKQTTRARLVYQDDEVTVYQVVTK